MVTKIFQKSDKPKNISSLDHHSKQNEKKIWESKNHKSEIRIPFSSVQNTNPILEAAIPITRARYEPSKRSII